MAKMLSRYLYLLPLLLCSSFSDGYPNQTFTNQTYNKKSSSKGVFVCITGQLPRLELKNKIERLLLPLHSLGFDLYIALALNNDTLHFSNNNNGDKKSLVASLDHAMSVLRGVEGVKEVMHYPPQHPDKMHVNKNYLKTLNKKNVETRVQNHVRQYQSLQFCNKWPLIKELTQMSVRVREDIFFEIINISEIISSVVEQGKVLSPSCDSWGGLNDKVAFLPSSHAHTFFQYPYDRYHTYSGGISVMNSEKFYKFVYLEKGLPLQYMPSLYVSKAVSKLVSSNSATESDAPFTCLVVANKHNSCSHTCDQSLFSKMPRNVNISSYRCAQVRYQFKKDPGTDYETNCW